MNVSNSKPHPLRVMIAGGGTGGHVYPGIAIGKEIKRRHPHAELLFVGTERGLEARLFLEFCLRTITASGLKMGPPGNFRGCKYPRSL
jgi:UDP-N-acetylglucosamine--N-acetylmuramyl-(pentapeptide) pyrophosphoryl-undecaprenol N-acetylglucosamine transferase